MTERAMGRIVTGAEYVRQITALESDRQARAAFWDLVAKIAPPHAALLDFGSGTGMDARFYVERGFAVAAYDVDPTDVPDPTAPENLERCCGRGLMLMRHYMTEVNYSRRGNTVHMRKHRK